MSAMSVQHIIDRYQARQGWTDLTVLDLLVEYIDNQASPEALEDFLNGKADIENGDYYS